MKLKCLLLVSLMALHANTFPSTDQFLLGIQKLIPSFDTKYLFDGPSSISSALITTPIMAMKPTREEMLYYNYYTACVYELFESKTMKGTYCSKVEGDITNFVDLENSTHKTAGLVTLSVKRKEIVVVYRGSTHWWNWVLDAYALNVSPHGTDRIKIHQGFYIATMSLYERVVKTVGAFRLLKKENGSFKLVLTGKTKLESVFLAASGREKGNAEKYVEKIRANLFQGEFSIINSFSTFGNRLGHSLGGAMARVTQFLLLHLKQFPGVSMEVYTYGERRNGNKDYVDFLNNQTIKTARIVNRADIVSHTPPTSILGTSIISDYYYHAMNEYWINGDQEQFASTSAYENPSTANSFGPQYTTTYHNSYFDVKPSITNVRKQEGFAVPTFLQPSGNLLSFPEPIRNVWSGIQDLHKRIATAMDGTQNIFVSFFQIKREFFTVMGEFGDGPPIIEMNFL